MDRDRFSISAQSLSTPYGTAASPLVIDVRRTPAFAAAAEIIPGAIHRAPEEIEAWSDAVPRDRQVVVYCVRGHEVSQDAAARLREGGVDARYLEGGIAAWEEAGLPLRRKAGGETGRWVTRERPKIDRIACPWLVRRFVDPGATFLYAPTERVFDVGARTGGYRL
ncbi:MAG TPA: chromate resistance protein ChrB domain-containing protein [Stellaceae bacterium]|jgi:rhodanese-related sulfurtransferase|nr:chromate resistance protein ChrB domain-containing protein [Stellaceae bacterium]